MCLRIHDHGNADNSHFQKKSVKISHFQNLQNKNDAPHYRVVNKLLQLLKTHIVL